MVTQICKVLPVSLLFGIIFWINLPKFFPGIGNKENSIMLFLFFPSPNVHWMEKGPFRKPYLNEHTTNKNGSTHIVQGNKWYRYFSWPTTISDSMNLRKYGSHINARGVSTNWGKGSIRAGCFILEMVKKFCKRRYYPRGKVNNG